PHPRAASNPVVMPSGELRGFRRVARQRAEKRVETSLVEGKIGWELPENRPQLFSQPQYARSKEIGERNLDVAQLLHVSDETAALDGEDEFLGSGGVPSGEQFRPLQGIERSIDLDRRESGASVSEFVLLPQFFRVENTAPRCIAPTGNSNPNAAGPDPWHCSFLHANMMPKLRRKTPAGCAPFRHSRHEGAQHGVETLAACLGGAQPGTIEHEKPAIDETLEPYRIKHGLRLGAAFAAEAGARHSLAEPQPHHQHLLEPFAVADRNALVSPLAALRDRSQPGFPRTELAGGDLRAVKRQTAMRPRTDADIVAVAPIDQIVPRFAAGARVVGYFIGRQTGLIQALLGEFVERPGAIVIGHGKIAACMRGVKRRAGLDGELVERKMIPGKAQRALELHIPLRRLLPRPRIDEIEGETRKM